MSVRGFINKKQSLAEVFHGISVLLKNEIYVPDEYKFLTKKFRELHATLLSKRELDILTLIAKEMTLQEIAETLFLSLSTVENHR
ncbi:MAG TPA: LuxR C-terminal-related transcriptional regulator [Chitinophagaceae bacterium]|nr:LuxR C-terminal-related transcriptional regulator [Chitinophagaceae bacterium]